MKVLEHEKFIPSERRISEYIRKKIVKKIGGRERNRFW
jgi:hypothetical protein